MDILSEDQDPHPNLTDMLVANMHLHLDRHIPAPLFTKEITETTDPDPEIPVTTDPDPEIPATTDLDKHTGVVHIPETDI